MKRAWAILLMFVLACGGEPTPKPGYAEAATAAASLGFEEARERQVARLLAEAPLDETRVRRAVEAARPALDVWAAATRSDTWTVTEASASRDDWEALAWLAYGDARLRLADGDAAGAFERALMVHRLGVLLGDAERAGVGEVVVSFGLREAGLVQLQRLAALAPPEQAVAWGAIGQISKAEAGLRSWPDALRIEAAAAEDRLTLMATDPAAALGLAAERLPPAARTAPDFDLAATREAVTTLVLRAADAGIADCAVGLPSGPPPGPGANLAGRLYAHQTAFALSQLFDRVCTTEAARRATLVILEPLAGLDRVAAPEDPFTDAPFARIGAALVSGGRGRAVPTRIGTGPFDPERPTYFLDARPLVEF